jgi:hypothetical protein
LILQITSCKPIEKKQPTEVPQTKEDFVKILREMLAPLHPPPSADTPIGLREDVRIQVLNNVFMFMQNNADNPDTGSMQGSGSEVYQWAKMQRSRNDGLGSDVLCVRIIRCRKVMHCNDL